MPLSPIDYLVAAATGYRQTETQKRAKQREDALNAQALQRHIDQQEFQNKMSTDTFDQNERKYQADDRRLDDQANDIRRNRIRDDMAAGVPVSDDDFRFAHGGGGAELPSPNDASSVAHPVLNLPSPTTPQFNGLPPRMPGIKFPPMQGFNPSPAQMPNIGDAPQRTAYNPDDYTSAATRATQAKALRDADKVTADMDDQTRKAVAVAFDDIGGLQPDRRANRIAEWQKLIPGYQFDTNITHYAPSSKTVAETQGVQLRNDELRAQAPYAKKMALAQYEGKVLDNDTANAVLKYLGPTAAAKLRGEVLSNVGKTIDNNWLNKLRAAQVAATGRSNTTAPKAQPLPTAIQTADHEAKVFAELSEHEKEVANLDAIINLKPNPTTFFKKNVVYQLPAKDGVTPAPIPAAQWSATVARAKERKAKVEARMKSLATPPVAPSAADGGMRPLPVSPGKSGTINVGRFKVKM